MSSIEKQTSEAHVALDSQDGPFYEDLEVGQKINHQDGRTITETDNIWFSLLSCNNNPVHTNQDYTQKNFAKAPFEGRMVVNSLLVLSVVIGLSVKDTSKNGIMLEIQSCKLTNPTFAGDTLYSRSEVISKRESKTHPNMGIISVKTIGYNQKNIQVLELQRAFMIRKNGKTWQ
ncbi:MAG: MaoC family dehydratase [Nitrososphaerota archaeon]|nr:MaoC family dehydratase [Nitrososphaerota archaeon]